MLLLFGAGEWLPQQQLMLGNAINGPCDVKTLISLAAKIVLQACELEPFIAALLDRCAGDEDDGDPGGAEFEAESRLKKLLERHR